MPRDDYSSLPGSDDRARLPAHIVILMIAMVLLFVGGGAGVLQRSTSPAIKRGLN